MGRASTRRDERDPGENNHVEDSGLDVARPRLGRRRAIRRRSIACLGFVIVEFACILRLPFPMAGTVKNSMADLPAQVAEPRARPSPAPADKSRLSRVAPLRPEVFPRAELQTPYVVPVRKCTVAVIAKSPRLENDFLPSVPASESHLGRVLVKENDQDVRLGGPNLQRQLRAWRSSPGLIAQLVRRSSPFVRPVGEPLLLPIARSSVCNQGHPSFRPRTVSLQPATRDIPAH